MASIGKEIKLLFTVILWFSWPSLWFDFNTPPQIDFDFILKLTKLNAYLWESWRNAKLIVMTILYLSFDGIKRYRQFKPLRIGRTHAAKRFLLALKEFHELLVGAI